MKVNNEKGWIDSLVETAAFFRSEIDKTVSCFEWIKKKLSSS